MLNSDSYATDTETEENEAAGEEQQRSEIRQKLETMTFEELLKLKEQMGSKLYNKMLSDDNKTSRKPIKIKRANKNRPQEISSKIKPKVLQRTFLVQKVKNKMIQYRDPRFDTLCGEFNKDKFKEDYKFIYDMQEKEKKILEKEEKLEQDVERKKKIRSVIQSLHNKSLEKEKVNEKIQKRKQEREGIKEHLKKGEAPFRKKKSTENAENLIAQYEELKKNNKLGKYLTKKSKKLNVKEWKKQKTEIDTLS